MSLGNDKKLNLLCNMFFRFVHVVAGQTKSKNKSLARTFHSYFRTVATSEIQSQRLQRFFFPNQDQSRLCGKRDLMLLF